MRSLLAVDEQIYGEESATVSMDCANLATLLKGRQSRSEKESLLRKAVAISESVWGADHVEYAVNLCKLGSQLRDETMLRRALEIFGANLDPNDVRIETVLWDLAGMLGPPEVHFYDVATKFDRWTEAEAMMRRALTIRVRGIRIQNSDGSGSLFSRPTLRDLGSLRSNEELVGHLRRTADVGLFHTLRYYRLTLMFLGKTDLEVANELAQIDSGLVEAMNEAVRIEWLLQAPKLFLRYLILTLICLALIRFWPHVPAWAVLLAGGLICSSKAGRLALFLSRRTSYRVFVAASALVLLLGWLSSLVGPSRGILGPTLVAACVPFVGLASNLLLRYFLRDNAGAKREDRVATMEAIQKLKSRFGRFR